MRFEVKSEQVTEKRGTSKIGRPYVIREQLAYMDMGKPYPVEIKINLDDLAAFKAGFYDIGKECFYVQRFGDLGVDLSRARPVAAEASGKQAAGAALR